MACQAGSKQQGSWASCMKPHSRDLKARLMRAGDPHLQVARAVMVAVAAALQHPLLLFRYRLAHRPRHCHCSLSQSHVNSRCKRHTCRRSWGPMLPLCRQAAPALLAALMQRLLDSRAAAREAATKALAELAACCPTAELLLILAGSLQVSRSEYCMPMPSIGCHCACRCHVSMCTGLEQQRSCDWDLSMTCKGGCRLSKQARPRQRCWPGSAVPQEQGRYLCPCPPQISGAEHCQCRCLTAHLHWHHGGCRCIFAHGCSLSMHAAGSPCMLPKRSSSSYL